jgi:predicted TIM-barrel fold metal-dependent hydrolase
MPEASFQVHAAALRALGLDHALVVQPAPYADDPAALLDAIARSEGRLRGVAVADAGTDARKLAAWAHGGVVALRFVEMQAPDGSRYPGSVGFDALVQLAPAMRQAGLHAQLWASADELVRSLPKLLDLGLPLVLDHMAMVDIGLGVAHASFQGLLDLLAEPTIWVKLTIARLAAGGAAARPFHEALLQAAPDRCLWGSDWPYVRLNPAPDAAVALDLFQAWTPGELIHPVLVDNPRRLLGG